MNYEWLAQVLFIKLKRLVLFVAMHKRKYDNKSKTRFKILFKHVTSYIA